MAYSLTDALRYYTSDVDPDNGCHSDLQLTLFYVFHVTKIVIVVCLASLLVVLGVSYITIATEVRYLKDTFTFTFKCHLKPELLF